MSYQAFVKDQMAKLRGVELSPQAKMQHIGQMWQASGMASTGRKVARGAVRGAVSGAKKAYKGGSMMSLHGGGVHLDNGTPLHPEMMGSGFWKKLGRDQRRHLAKIPGIVLKCDATFVLDNSGKTLLRV